MTSGSGGEDRSISERVYRVLLRAYPREFRETYGRQMEQVFGELYREEASRGGRAGLMRLWVRVGLDLALSAAVQRSYAEDKEAFARNDKLAGAGLVLLLAPLYFVSASLLKYGLSVGFLFDPLEALLSEPGRLYLFNLVSPLVFLGGLVLALALNASSFVRLGVDRGDGEIVGTMRLEVKPANLANLANLAVAATSLLLLGTLVGYVFVENFAFLY